MTQEITNSSDIIDSLDVIARIDDLESDDNRDTAEDEELSTLSALAREGGDYAADWETGEILIRDTYFRTYAQELAEDCGLLDDSASTWPTNCIDWDQAARELQADYTSITFDGVDYWVR